MVWLAGCDGLSGQGGVVADTAREGVVWQSKLACQLWMRSLWEDDTDTEAPPPPRCPSYTLPDISNLSTGIIS